MSPLHRRSPVVRVSAAGDDIDVSGITGGAGDSRFSINRRRTAVQPAKRRRSREGFVVDAVA